ncbi:hypothetical protein [Phaeovulum vinaykumarii]|uniref:Lipoprotein n=1 Tax=Phaeovulum vinaykumarii TaxID=407234 RepID=A0A1N7KSW1_9RHOB|nr:hypothetical protein [Phaeovulum vinaykumarii]SIS64712.1 hypothetical protein SAMN05421795_102135 [Phaeovulum vinaykumarii]SOC01510.1 hypothetical protein SAMN05878426_102639 [Phaeovulum vinaykumarii]
MRLGMRPAFALPLLAVLAACGTPQERCINSATRELRAVSALRAETEANLARGYAWEEYTITRSRWEWCAAPPLPPKPDGTQPPPLPPRMCLEEYTDTARRRVAIDPAAETRKRDNLIARERQLERQARADVAACKARFPEE